jgi:hypothetical protein
MSDFSLRAVIRQVATRSTIRDPDALADEIMRQIPSEHFLDALRAAIKPMVREVISEERPHGTFTRGVGRASTQPAISTPTRGSMKVTAIRDGWQDHLRARYSVERGEWKFLGECTYEDLQFIAARLDRQAEMHASKARGMRSLAAALTDHDAETVRDLPPAFLMTALGAAA